MTITFEQIAKTTLFNWGVSSDSIELLYTDFANILEASYALELRRTEFLSKLRSKAH